jgi:hypothetical protein
MPPEMQGTFEDSIPELKNEVDEGDETNNEPFEPKDNDFSLP